MRHGTCFRRRLSAHHAGAAPHSAVAELGVVRRRYARPEQRKSMTTPTGHLDPILGRPAIPGSATGTFGSRPGTSRIASRAFRGRSRTSRHAAGTFRERPGTSGNRFGAFQRRPGMSRHGFGAFRQLPGTSRHAFGAFREHSRTSPLDFGTFPERIYRVVPPVCPFFTVPLPNRTETPNHALQRTAPRVTARAFCERSAIYIWASSVRSTVGHAPRHAPPSLSLGSLAVSRTSLP